MTAAVHASGIFVLHPLAYLPYMVGAFAVAIALIMLGNVLHRMTAGAVMMEPGLYGITGRMGRGKSYLMALVAWRAKRHRRRCCSKANYPDGHRPIYANFHIDGATEYSNWTEVLGVPHGSIVFMDEVQLWWGSADYGAPVEVRAWVTQLRKNHLTVLWATQDASFVARWFRVLSFGIWECGKSGRKHRYTLVDPSQAGLSPARQKSLSKFHVVRKRKVMAQYDTLGLVKASREWGAEST